MSQATLQNYLDLCKEVYNILLKENTLLKTSKEALDEALLQSKKDLLDQLSASIDGLKDINKQPRVEGIHRNQLIKSCQRFIMKILMLNRENEQLVYKKDFNEKKELFTLPPSKLAALEAYANSFQKHNPNSINPQNAH